jgi:hypothetical protein
MVGGVLSTRPVKPNRPLSSKLATRIRWDHNQMKEGTISTGLYGTSLMFSVLLAYRYRLEYPASSTTWNAGITLHVSGTSIQEYTPFREHSRMIKNNKTQR